MFTVVISEKEGPERRLSFNESEVTIGRVPGNDVVLPKGNVSKRHSRIVLKDNRFIVVDLKSTNGTYVNGRKITSPLVVKEGDKIYVGDFVLTLEGDPSMTEAGPVSDTSQQRGASVPPPPLPVSEPRSDSDLPPVLRDEGPGSPLPPIPPASVTPADDLRPRQTNPELRNEHALSARAGNGSHQDEFVLEDALEISSEEPKPASPSMPPVLAVSSLPARLASTPPRRSSPPGGVEPPDGLALRRLMQQLTGPYEEALASGKPLFPSARLDRLIQGKVSELIADGSVSRNVDRALLTQAAVRELTGLGAIDALLDDPAVFHIVAERYDRLYADFGEGLQPQPHTFSSADAFARVVERLCEQRPDGHDRNDRCAFSLASGLYVVCVLPPAANDGPLLSLRRRPGSWLSPDELARQLPLSEHSLRALHEALAQDKPVWIVGDDRVAVSQTVQRMAAELPPAERVALFEEFPEVAVGTRPAISLKLSDTDLGEQRERLRQFAVDYVVVHGVRQPALRSVLTALAAQPAGSIASSSALGSAEAALAAFESAVGPDLTLRAAGLIVEAAPAQAEGQPATLRLFRLAREDAGGLELVPVLSAEAASEAS